MRRRLPWYAMVAAKLLLTRLPFKYRIWRKLNLFVHGSMDDPAYAHRVFQQHFDRCRFARKNSEDGFVALEIGPGDSLLSAIVAKTYGAATSYLVDSGAYATADIRPYRAVADHLRSLNLSPPDLNKISNLTEVLSVCNAVYATQGLNAIRDIPSNSVDFIWSHAVLEHIRRHEFLPFMCELQRILRPDGACSHRIDLRDHLGGALNNLRIPSRYWEAEWMARSGFYTNRIRYKEMLNLLRQSGFDVEIVGTERWERLPTPRKEMALEYRQLDEDDLLVSGFDVLLRPKSAIATELPSAPTSSIAVH